MADENGIVIVPKEKAEEVLEISEELLQKEESMVKQLKEGIPFKEVDRNAEYNKMVE